MSDQIMEEARLLLGAKQWKEAIVAAELGLAQQTDDPELAWIAGWANLKLARYDRAVPYLLKAAKLGPIDPERYWALGVSLLELGEFGRAESWLLRGLAVRDTYDNRIALALLYMKQQDVEMAEAIHKEGLRLQGGDPERVEAYADFLCDTRRDEEADRMYARARELAEASNRNKA